MGVLMTFTKSLCLRCYRKKYRGRSFVTYLKDLELSEGIACVDCGAVAEIQVEINIDETHVTTDPHRFLSYWANLIDFTTFAEHKSYMPGVCMTLARHGEIVEIYLDEIAKLAEETGS